MSKKPDNPTPEEERRYLTFRTLRIPWYVHLVWISYWILVIGHVIFQQLPLIGAEISNPP